MRLGLLLIATNKYTDFLNPLIKSADEFLLKDDNIDVEYLVFSNLENIILETKRKYSLFEVEHKPWPGMTLFRYHMFLSKKEDLLKYDYLFYCDVDMLFIDKISIDDIIGELVSTIGGLIPSRGTPELNPISTAFISQNESLTYYIGGFNGGRSENFLTMSETISKNIDKDLENNYIAIWHDESHINRYFLDNPPTKVIQPPFCIAEGQEITGTKLIALYKIIQN